MNKETKLEIKHTSWELHSKVEEGYLNHPAIIDEDSWLEKQHLLIADMALHL